MTTTTPALEVPNLGPSGLEIPRDRWGRPLILPDPALVEPGVEPGKPTGYTRASTLGKVLEEQSALTAWKQRMTLIGILEAPHLMMTASSCRNDRDALNKLCEEALVKAQAGAAAERGTALHAAWEAHDKGLDPGPIPVELRPVFSARLASTAGFEWAAVEKFVVCDQLLAAGTADRFRVVRPKGRSKAKPTLRVVDDKTGDKIEYGMLGIAVQLAIYAHGKSYDPATGVRGPVYVTPEGDELEVDLRVAEVIHTPASGDAKGTSRVLEVDIAAGWAAAGIAKSVKGLRNDARKWAKVASESTASLADLVAACTTEAALFALYEQRGAEFDAKVGPLASARLALLRGGVLA